MYMVKDGNQIFGGGHDAVYKEVQLWRYTPETYKPMWPQQKKINKRISKKKKVRKYNFENLSFRLSNYEIPRHKYKIK